MNICMFTDYVKEDYIVSYYLKITDLEIQNKLYKCICVYLCVYLCSDYLTHIDLSINAYIYSI